MDTEWGSFRVEECVTRDGDRDRYEYTVTNLNFVYDGCGLCEFYVPNFHGFPTLDQWGPVGWLVNPWGEWSWHAPLGDCGITAGRAEQFGFAVPSPTTDALQWAAAAGCPKPIGPGGLLILLPRIEFRTTGPAPGDEGGCPDLVVVRLTACWRFTPRQEIEGVVTAAVQDVGTANSGPFWVNTDVSSGSGGGSSLDFFADLAPGGVGTISASVVVSSPAGGVPFPTTVTVTADTSAR